MGYIRLTIKEREEISRYLAAGFSFRAIARELNRSVSTISREVGRYKQKARYKYRAIASHKKAFQKASSRNFGNYKLFKNEALFEVVVSKLKLYWSPDQIAKFLKQNYQDPKMHISPESIYTYIFILPRGALREELTQYMRHGHKRRRKQGVYTGGSWQVEDMISIEERPAEVATRTVPGHWEGDLIIGGAKEQTALGTLVERTTRALILVPLKNKSAVEVRKAFAKELKKIPQELRLSLTYDQGREMSQHKLFTEETQMQVYFAHPRSPWERGTNENTNGLLRQFFPKSTNFNNISRKEIKKVQDLMNGRPRKTLDYKTPYEAFQELLQ